MKIQCQSCQAKYTIADEKIGRKVFELHCKQCSATIVIDGSATPRDESATTTAFDYAGGSSEEWSVNVADGDRRTMTTAEIAREYAAGVVDDDTYCWKEGMDDWLPICEIEQLYGVAKPPPVHSEAQTPEPSEAPPSTSAARRDGGRGRGADLFGNAAKAGSEEEEVAKKTASSPAPSPNASPAPSPAPTTEAKAAEGPKLTGARSEDSVLFSVSSVTSETTDKGGGGGKLAALSLSSSPTTTTTSSSSPSSQSSGLIDIRSLSADIDKDESGPKKGGSNESSVDDIMNLSGGGAFGSALAAPVLGLSAGDSTSSSIAPTGESRPNKSLVPAVLGGAALIAVAIVAAVLLSRPPAPQPVGTGPTATMTGVGTAPTGSVAVADPTTTTGGNVPPAPGTGTASAKVAGLAPSDKNARPVVASTAASVAASGTTPDETAPAASAAPPTPAPAPTPDKPADFASALANAAGKTDEKPPENAGGGGSEAQFDRGAAAGALGGIDYQGCKKPDGPTGAGHVTVTFGPDGNVASAIVDQGPFPGTAVGGCIAGKFRAAHVPPFSGAAVRVGKSFTLN